MSAEQLRRVTWRCRLGLQYDNTFTHARPMFPTLYLPLRSDKTGTLTMNQMTVVEGWFGDKHVPADMLRTAGVIKAEVLDLVTQNCSINRSCEVHFKVRHQMQQLL